MSHISDTHIENLLVATAMMIDVAPAFIVQQLRSWKAPLPAETMSCGSAACFGGLVAQHPFFQAQGIYADPDGAPLTEFTVFPSDVAQQLFGDCRMFDPNYKSKLSDRGEILRRIRTQLHHVLDTSTAHCK